MKKLSQGTKKAHSILFLSTHLKLMHKIDICELLIFWPYNSFTPAGTPLCGLSPHLHLSHQILTFFSPLFSPWSSPPSTVSLCSKLPTPLSMMFFSPMITLALSTTSHWWLSICSCQPLLLVNVEQLTDHVPGQGGTLAQQAPVMWSNMPEVMTLYRLLCWSWNGGRSDNSM